MIKQAFILAAGLGLRMRPITDKIPKPMIEIGGQSIITRIIDALVDFGIEQIVVNASYRAEQLIEHVIAHIDAIDASVGISFSEEDEPLETGGGVIKALPLLSNEPFFIVNSDSLFLSSENVFSLLDRAWRPSMEVLFLLCDKNKAVGYEGKGDFLLDSENRLKRAANSDEDRPYIYTGIHISQPKFFKGRPMEKIGLMAIYQPLIDSGSKGMCGMIMPGEWLHVGTPNAVAVANERFARATSLRGT